MHVAQNSGREKLWQIDALQVLARKIKASLLP